MATFDDTYKVIYSYTFEATDTPGRAYCRPNVERRCWYCGRLKGETSFSSDAHVIPAAFGNRSLFSLEECNEHNNGFSKIETDLADFLTLMRAVARIRTRKGSFKYRRGNDRSYIEGRPDDNRLMLELYDGESSLQLEDLGEGEALLRMTVPPSNPVNACKALARMAYFCLPEEDRARNGHIKSWLRGEANYLPVFHQIFLPGTGQRLIALRIYRAHSEQAGISPYLVEFDYGSVVLFLPLPGPDLQRPSRTVLPDVPHSPFPPHVPHYTTLTCVRDERTQRHVEEIKISYRSKIDISKLDANADPSDLLAQAAVLTIAEAPSLRTTLELKDIECPVKLLLIGREGQILSEIPTSIRRTHLGASGFELTIANEHAGWSLNFVVLDDGSANCSPELSDPCQLPLEAARDHLQLLKNMQQTKTLELRALGSNAPLVWAEVGAFKIDWDPSLALEIAERLLLITKATGAEFRLPRQADPQVVRQIEFASSAVEYGAFVGPTAEHYDVPLNQASISYLEQHFQHGNGPTGMTAPLGDHMQVLDKQIPTGLIKLMLEEPRLVGELSETIEKLRAITPPNCVDIKFTARRASYSFGRFLRPDKR